MDCRNFETFAKEFDRMCTYYTNNHQTCKPCPFYPLGCFQGAKDNPVESVEILQKWSDNHPIHTRQDKVLEILPNIPMDDGVIDIAPCEVEKECRTWCRDYTCAECRRNYWLEAIED